jgi:uncharacterized protein (DUF2126 family)
MSVVQQVLLRSLVARFWEKPYAPERLARWGTELHDRFMLPYFVWTDFEDVIAEMRREGFDLSLDWFKPHFEFRFPKYGDLDARGVHLEVRGSLEPWHVMAEDATSGGTARYVDSSLERLQVHVTGLPPDRYVVSCNGRALPLAPTGTKGEYVAGVRNRAWQPPRCLHPTIGVHSPLVFDLLDMWNKKSIGGCTWHVSHPGGRHYATFPVNAYEAESRRVARFFQIGHTPGIQSIPEKEKNVDYPFTLDMRRA